MFKVIIIGGEGFEDYALFEHKCIKCLSKKASEGCGIMIYTTGDSFVEKFSGRFGINLRYFKADWKKHEKDALKERNAEMISLSDAAIIFEDGLKDTKMFADQIIAANIPYRIITKD